MKKAKIQDELQEIQQALTEERQAHPERAEETAQLQREIDYFLQASPQPDTEEHQRMLAPLKNSIEQFEASHPNLGLLIEKFLDTLSNLGI